MSELKEIYVCKCTGYKGIQAYKRGCRCDGCKAEKSERNRQVIQTKIEKDGELWASQKRWQLLYGKRYNLILSANRKLATMMMCKCFKVAKKERRSKEERGRIAAANAWESIRVKLKHKHGSHTLAKKYRCECDQCSQFRKRACNQIHARTEHRRKTDPDFRIMHNQRARFRRWISASGIAKRSSVTKLIGLTPNQLWEYLLSHPNNADGKFTKDNYGKAWHIDHITPVSSVDPNDDEQMRRVWHHTNLQPLTPEDNMAKGSR